jgi:hypothetical protein
MSDLRKRDDSVHAIGSDIRSRSSNILACAATSVGLPLMALVSLTLGHALDSQIIHR